MLRNAVKLFRISLDTNKVAVKHGLHSKPNFTKNIFNIKRGTFNCVEEEHLIFFRKLLGESRIITDLSDLEKYNVNWQRNLRGKGNPYVQLQLDTSNGYPVMAHILLTLLLLNNSPANALTRNLCGSTIVLKPKTTDEVSKILAYCNDNLLAVCPQAGNTGVVGGATPVFDEIVISTDLMNEIIHLDERMGILTCQAGCILQNLENFVAEKNFTFPLDLGAKGSCQIGGNISTNAGGLRVLRYGNLHGNILGLEVVQANGEVLDLLSTLKKDNTGYHLKHLFIGSEGTLGIVTKVAVQCKQKAKSVHLAFLGLQNFDQVLKTFYKSKEDMDEILTAFEVIDTPTMEMVNDKLEMPSPIGNYPFYVLIETTGSNEEHDQQKLDKFLENCMKKNYVLNGTVTGEPGKVQEIWAIREKIPDAYKKDGYHFMYDVSLPLEHYYKLVEDMRERMGDLSHRVFGFGHLGDGNLHINVAVKEYSPEIEKYIEPYIYERVKMYNGSVSAEHGLGFLKAKYLPLMKSEAAINAMKNIKKVMDPNGILNPYKILL